MRILDSYPRLIYWITILFFFFKGTLLKDLRVCFGQPRRTVVDRFEGFNSTRHPNVLIHGIHVAIAYVGLPQVYRSPPVRGKRPLRNRVSTTSGGPWHLRPFKLYGSSVSFKSFPPQVPAVDRWVFL